MYGAYYFAGSILATFSFIGRRDRLHPIPRGLKGIVTVETSTTSASSVDSRVLDLHRVSQYFLICTRTAGRDGVLTCTARRLLPTVGKDAHLRTLFHPILLRAARHEAARGPLSRPGLAAAMHYMNLLVCNRPSSGACPGFRPRCNHDARGRRFFLRCRLVPVGARWCRCAIRACRSFVRERLSRSLRRANYVGFPKIVNGLWAWRRRGARAGPRARRASPERSLTTASPDLKPLAMDAIVARGAQEPVPNQMLELGKTGTHDGNIPSG